MKKTKFTSIILAFASAVALPMAAQAQEVILKVHHFLPTTTFLHTITIGGWCDKIAKESNGRMKCRIYPSMQLGGTPAQLIDQARDGVADIVFSVPTYQPGAFVKTEVFELPFMAGSSVGGARAMWDYIQQNALAEFHGTRPLWVTIGDHSLLHFSGKNVASLDDLKGMKVRSPSRYGAKALSALGALPVQMAASTVTESISKGILDGAMLPWSAVQMLKLDEVTKTHTDFAPNQAKLTNAIAVFVMNKAKYDSLPADLKKIIDANSGSDMSARAGQIYADQMTLNQVARVRAGDKVNYLTDIEYARWVKATAGVEDEWVAEVNAKGGDGKKLLGAAKSLVKKYEK
jgi:TRAP-type C4-dicarboxylate transport system substrate-binding protein